MPLKDTDLSLGSRLTLSVLELARPNVTADLCSALWVKDTWQRTRQSALPVPLALSQACPTGRYLDHEQVLITVLCCQGSFEIQRSRPPQKEPSPALPQIEDIPQCSSPSLFTLPKEKVTGFWGLAVLSGR